MKLKATDKADCNPHMCTERSLYNAEHWHCMIPDVRRKDGQHKYNYERFGTDNYGLRLILCVCVDWERGVCDSHRENTTIEWRKVLLCLWFYCHDRWNENLEPNHDKLFKSSTIWPALDTNLTQIDKRDTKLHFNCNRNVTWEETTRGT